MLRSIKDDLLKDDKYIGDLEVFLASEFGSSSQSEDNIVNHGGQLEIIYCKKRGGISDIYLTNGADKTLLENLRPKVEKALYQDHGTKVGMDYVFLKLPVEAFFRYDNDFQIIPVPPGAPKPKDMLADHPAIVEFSYPASSNNLVDNHRKDLRRRELFEVLNTLIFTGMSWTSNIVTKYWVYKPIDKYMIDSPIKLESIYCQEGYTCDYEWNEKDDKGFSINPSWVEIEREPANEYYNQRGIKIGNNFKLPDSIEHSLSRINAIGQADLRAFQRAAHWLKKSSEVFTSSHSLSYCALVYALESLIEEPFKTGKCTQCGRDTFDKSISQRFRELLDHHRAGLPKKDIDEIYRIRSAIAHGGGLMPRDREITGFRFNADHNQKDAVFRQLQHVCQIVLLNWLHTPK